VRVEVRHTPQRTALLDNLEKSNVITGRCPMGLKRRILCAFALSLIITSPLGIPMAAHAQQSAPLSTTNSSSPIRIDNFGRIDQSYFRGAQPMGHDYSDLASLGVKTVINLTSDDAQANERAMVEGAGMAYLHIPMNTHEPPTSAQLAQFLMLVNDPAHQPVYVHCVGGKHRTGVMTAVYRITQHQWTAEQAFREMKQYKFGADVLHPEFKRFVYAYRVEPQRPELVPTVIATTTIR
jgi:tyrosine-protein phosphatase SIW14